MPKAEKYVASDFNADKFDLDEAKFQTALDFLRDTDLETVSLGWHDLENGVRASVQEYDSFDPDTVYYETHERFHDLQYVVSGEELIGVRSRDGLVERIAYDDSNDITFYQQPGDEKFVYLKAGDFVVLTPSDAHKPRCRVNRSIPIRKIVFKIPV